MFVFKVASFLAILLSVMGSPFLQAEIFFSEYGWMGGTTNIGGFSKSDSELIKNARSSIDLQCLAIDVQNRRSLFFDARKPSRLILLELDSGESFASVPSTKYQPTIAAFSGDGKVVAVDHPQKFVVDEPATIRLWRVGKRLDEIETFELEDASPITQLVVSHTGNHFAFQNGNSTKVYDVAHQNPLLVLTNPSYRDGRIQQIGAIAFSGDGKQVAMVTTMSPSRNFKESRFEVYSWDLDTMQSSVLYKGLVAASKLAYSNDGKWLAVSSDGLSGCPPRVVVIDAESGAVVNDINFHGHPVWDYSIGHLLFGPDDKSIVTDSGGAITVWDVASSELKMALLSPTKISHLSLGIDKLTIVGNRWPITKHLSLFAPGNAIQPKGTVITDIDLSAAFAAQKEYKVIGISDGHTFGLKKWDSKANPISELKRLGGEVTTDHVHVYRKKGNGRMAVTVSPKQIENYGALQTIVDDDLANLVNIEGIVSLQLNGSFSDEALSHVGKMKSLEHLNLFNTFVTNAGMKHLSSLSNIETIQLPSEAKLGPDGIAQLSELKKLRELPPVAKLNDETLKHISKLTGLENLPYIYGYDGATDTGIAYLRSLSHLRSLKFQRSEITNNGLQLLKQLPSLSYIRLWECPNISDEGLKHVSHLGNLTRLELNGTEGIHDEGLRYLQSLRKLTHLYLNGTSVTDRGLLHLHSLASLEFLGLNDTKVTPEAVRAIQKTLPKCTVSSGRDSLRLP